MKELNRQETQYVAGGCGPGMFDGLIEGAIAIFGVGMFGAFAMGMGAAFLIQYVRSH